MHRLQKPGRTASRVVSVFVFMFLLAVTANAYTVVMRGGRRIEIPSSFAVTASTLTYEAAPGVQVTLQIIAIDIPATEKANNEPPGSFLRRAQATPASLSESQNGGKAEPSPQARITITNRDLDASMRRRRESELAYENRRKQLGLPSVADSRKQAAAAADAIGIDLEQRRIAEQESEEYWRGRAAELRTEMAAMDAEIAWIRAQLDEGPLSGWGSGSFTSVTSVIPFISFGNVGRRSFGNFGPGGFHRQGVHRPGIFVAPRQDTRLTGRVAFGGGATRGRGLINLQPFPHVRSRGFGGGFPVFPGLGVFGSSSQDYDYSYERSALITQFNELAGARAGLKARWRELEEEARRAGAPPGWLRP